MSPATPPTGRNQPGGAAGGEPEGGETWGVGGITTIWFGGTREGALAPDAFQLGKYDIFTTTGLPTWLTSKERWSSAELMLDTTGGSSTGTRGVSRARGPSRGPPAGVTGGFPRASRGTAARGQDLGPLA